MTSESESVKLTKDELTVILLRLQPNLADRLIEHNRAIEREMDALRERLNEEQLAHEEIGTICAEVGAAATEGTSLSAVKDMVKMVRALESRLAASETRAKAAEASALRDGREEMRDSAIRALPLDPETKKS